MYSFTAEILRTTVQRRTGCDILLAVGVDTGSTVHCLYLYLYIQRHIRTHSVYILFFSVLFYSVILYYFLFYFSILSYYIYIMFYFSVLYI